LGKKALRISVFVLAGLAGLTAAAFFVLIYPRKTIAPILLYHSISGPGGNAGAPAISKDILARQLEYLKKNGYEPVYLDTVIRTFKNKKKVPANWVVLTFDDGSSDFYTVAYPLLKQYGFKATLFISSGLVGVSDGYVTWDQLRAISADGLVEIGSHSLLHSPLTCLTLEEARKRIEISKLFLEQNLGTEIKVFAYPYGALTCDIREIVEKSGYEGAVGTVYPRGQFRRWDVFNLRRVYVSRASRYLLVFKFMLSGYYVPVRSLALRMFNIHTPRDAENCLCVM
jgi:peptidoglycan/xylan/chitin deacetylase (PgdA/CDA1 family)